MKFGETTIPTPPKGFQTMFQLWLIRHDPDRDDSAYTLESPKGNIFHHDIFYLDDNGAIYAVCNKTFMSLPSQGHWDRLIADRIDLFNHTAKKLPYLPLDESAIALKMPDFEYVGARWFVFGSPEIALQILAKSRHGDDEKRAFIALFAHFHKDRYVAFQALIPLIDDLVKKCAEHIELLEQEEYDQEEQACIESLCRNAPPESPW